MPPGRWKNWNGHFRSKTGKLNMPNLDGKDGKVYLYGNGIFISLGGIHSKAYYSHAYIKCGYANQNAYLGKASHYKDCSGWFGGLAGASKYYGDYWKMIPTYSGDVIKFRYDSPQSYPIGKNKEWQDRTLDPNSFNFVEGQTVYFASNGQNTFAWSHKGGEQIFPFGEDVLMTNMFVNNVYGTNVNGGNLDWTWTVSYGTYSRSFK